MNLKTVIESILFVAGRPVSLKELANVANTEVLEIEKILRELIAEKKDSGIVILEQNQSYLMSTNPENAAAVKTFLNAELREELTQAAIETLAIITYKQPVSHPEIEAIRGVNSQYTLRLLLMRGLVEKIPSPKDSRLNLYRTTHEFLQHLGLKSLSELPDFEELTAKVKPPEGFDASNESASSPS